jgi:hypothetical protein
LGKDRLYQQPAPGFAWQASAAVSAVDQMRYAAKTDKNQAEIVAALRTVGCSVLPLHAVGQGCPDLLVATTRETMLIEVKDGDKPPSARKLTPDQVEFHATWRGRIAVVCNVKEALEAVGIPYRGVVS